MKEPSANSSGKKQVSDSFRTKYGGREPASNIIDKFNSISKGKRKMNQSHIEQINELREKGFTDDNILDGLIKYEDVLENYGSGVTFANYMRAIEFVGYVVGSSSYKKAYELTFPKKTTRLDNNNLNVSASRYANSRLVKNMLERVYLNQHIFFIDKTIQAKMKLYELGMDDSVSDRERVNALDKFLTHTAKYEDKSGLTINNFVQSGSVNIVNAIDDKLKKLAEIAQNQIEEGIVDAKLVAEDGIKIEEN